MTIADTNYIIRLFTKTPADAARQAVADIEASEPEALLLRDYVMSEAAYVLQYHDELAYNRQQIAQGLRLILSHPAWRANRALHEQALHLFEASTFDYVDCLVVVEYELGHAKRVLTFDKQLQARLRRLQ